MNRHHARRRVHRCSKCGAITYALKNHAPRYVQRAGALVLVDCQGQEIKGADRG